MSMSGFFYARCLKGANGRYLVVLLSVFRHIAPIFMNVYE